MRKSLNDRQGEKRVRTAWNKDTMGQKTKKSVILHKTDVLNSGFQGILDRK